MGGWDVSYALYSVLGLYARLCWVCWRSSIQIFVVFLFIKGAWPNTFLIWKTCLGGTLLLFACTPFYKSEMLFCRLKLEGNLLWHWLLLLEGQLKLILYVSSNIYISEQTKVTGKWSSNPLLHCQIFCRKATFLANSGRFTFLVWSSLNYTTLVSCTSCIMNL